jgi:NAD(P)-dependent dehydrogenase (short-subunit alcohol dehydrogenase family)
VKEFTGKVAVITGAASGMGRAVAGRCAQEGMKVVLADIQQDALQKAESELKAEGATVLAVRTDVSKAADLEALAKKTIDAFGAVHLLHNNAGVSAGNAVWETTLADWNWAMGVNLWGVIHGIWAFLPIMLKQDTECHIVNTASMGGLMSTPFIGAVYNVSKFGVIAISETLFHEMTLMGSKIGVSVLCPGYVNTRITDPQRNRPAEMLNDPTWEATLKAKDHVKMISEMGHDGCESGMDPKQVADFVFNAIQEDKFYIITHPEWMMAGQMRMDEILQDRQPTSMMTAMILG